MCPKVLPPSGGGNALVSGPAEPQGEQSRARSFIREPYLEQMPGAASAASIGHAVILGLGGMTASRIVLGPIGVAASLVTLPIGVALARNRERNYIQQTDKAAHRMACLAEIIERSRSRMKPLLPQNSRDCRRSATACRPIESSNTQHAGRPRHSSQAGHPYAGGGSPQE